MSISTASSTRSTRSRARPARPFRRSRSTGCLQRPTVSSVIIGARNEEQLRQNLGAVGWTLTPEQVARLDAASERPRAYPYWHQRARVLRAQPAAGLGGAPMRGRRARQMI